MIDFFKSPYETCVYSQPSKLKRTYGYLCFFSLFEFIYFYIYYHILVQIATLIIAFSVAFYLELRNALSIYYTSHILTLNQH